MPDETLQVVDTEITPQPAPLPALPDELQALVVMLPKKVMSTCAIDVSDIWDRPPGTRVFTYREPSTAELYGQNELAPKIKEQAPDFPDTLCANIGLMALCHLTPPVGDKSNPAWLLYGEFVKRVSAARFIRWTDEFFGAFPALKDLPKAVGEEKKDSREIVPLS